MELQRVVVHQFLSVEHEELTFEGEGLTLVLGVVHGSSAAESNGAGKSALFVEPLLWALYDRLVRANKRFKKEVKRRYRGTPVQDDTWVEVEFSHKGKDYRIRRSLEDGYEIQVDGDDETPYRVTEGKKKVESILGLDVNLFQAIAVVGQGFPSRFTGF